MKFKSILKLITLLVCLGKSYNSYSFGISTGLGFCKKQTYFDVTFPKYRRLKSFTLSPLYEVNEFTYSFGFGFSNNLKNKSSMFPTLGLAYSYRPSYYGEKTEPIFTALSIEVRTNPNFNFSERQIDNLIDFNIGLIFVSGLIKFSAGGLYLYDEKIAIPSFRFTICPMTHIYKWGNLFY